MWLSPEMSLWCMARSVLGKTFQGMALPRASYERRKGHAMAVFRSAARRTAQPPPPDIGGQAEYRFPGLSREAFSLYYFRGKGASKAVVPVRPARQPPQSCGPDQRGVEGRRPTTPH